MKGRHVRVRKSFLNGLLKGIRIRYRAWHVEYIDSLIDMMRVPYGGQPIAQARKQERRMRERLGDLPMGSRFGAGSGYFPDPNPRPGMSVDSGSTHGER